MPEPSLQPFHEDDGAADRQLHVFRLFVSGSTPRSARAIVNARQFCETHLSGCYELEIVDLSLHPEMAANEQIVAAPTLIRQRPLPRRQFIGDLSDANRLRDGLGLPGDT